jgi:hypothetical protein
MTATSKKTLYQDWVHHTIKSRPKNPRISVECTNINGKTRNLPRNIGIGEAKQSMYSPGQAL